MPDRMSDTMPDRMTEYMSDRVPECQSICQIDCQIYTSGRLPEFMSAECRIQCELKRSVIECQNRCQIMSDRMPEYMSDRNAR